MKWWIITFVSLTIFFFFAELIASAVISADREEQLKIKFLGYSTWGVIGGVCRLLKWLNASISFILLLVRCL